MRAVNRKCEGCGAVLTARQVQGHRCGLPRLVLSYADGHETPMRWPPMDLGISDLHGYLERLTLLFRERGIEALPVLARIVSAGGKLLKKWMR